MLVGKNALCSGLIRPQLEITRTRDETLLATMDAVVDVGGVYDASTLRFDHHQVSRVRFVLFTYTPPQPTFKDTFSPGHKTLLSSAGLIFK